MKKITSILVALLLIVSCVPFAVSAAVATQTVTIAAPAEAIEVNPGDTYVPVTWTITENEGWAAFKMFIEFDGDVFSFAPGGETTRNNKTGTFGFYLFHDDYPFAYMDNIGAVTSNIYGIDVSADPQITKDKSAILVENSSNTEDSTATGSFFTAFLNVAADAPAGEYKITITTDPNNCSSIKGADVAKPVMTWGEATIVVKGTSDDRLTVQGAQVRLASGETKQGLRFISNIDVELYNILKDSGSLPTSSASTGVGFGTVVLPTSMLDGAALTKETTNAVTVPAVKLYKAPAANDTVYSYTACLTDLEEDQYATEYTVRPYITYMDGEEEVTIYGEQYSTSVYAVAEAAYLSGNETGADSEYLRNNILSKVNPTKYPAESWSGIYKP